MFKRGKKCRIKVTFHLVLVLLCRATLHLGSDFCGRVFGTGFHL